MHILVTGGAGFVGSNLCVLLKDSNPTIEITAFDNLRRRGSELNIKRFKEKGINFVHGDIRNYDDLETIDFDILIEASAEPSVLAGLDGGRRYLLDTNLNGLINACEACLKKNAKMIFLSSSRIYPMRPINDMAYTENTIRYIAPIVGIDEGFTKDGARTLYGASKYSAELIIEEYKEMFALKAIVNRCGVLAGPWQFGKVDQGFMTLWVANHIYKNPLKIFGNGKQVRDVLHIHDLFLLILQQIQNFELFSGELFNVGGGEFSSTSLLELESICTELVGANELSFGEERGLDLKYYVTDHSKITALCGWKPTKNISDVVCDIRDWIESNKEELRWIFA